MPAEPRKDPLVVLVNDDELQLGLLVGVLSKHPWRVLGFRSAGEALTAMERERPSLLITDLYMPEIDGWTFCRMLRSPAYAELNRVPILVLSGVLATEDALQIAAELGATDFMTLPVDGTLLCDRVRTLIESPSPAPSWKVLLIMQPGEEVDRVKGVFDAHECHIRLISDITEVPQILHDASWEAAICDLDLPGCSLALAAQWIESAPHSAFVFTSSDPSPQSAVNSLRVGASAHLRRPFAADYLFGLCELARQKNALVRAQRMLERRTVELRNSDRLLQAILDSSEQVYTVIDHTGHVDMANRAARRIASEILGGPLKEGDGVLALLPSEMSDRTQESLALALAGRVVRHDAEVTDRAGKRRRFMVRYTPLPGSDGTISRVCFNAQDMTARIEAEDALRLRNHALSSITQGVIIADVHRRITYVNDSFIHITGHNRADIVGQLCSFVQGPLTDPETVRRIRETLAAGKIFTGEILNYRKNGETFWNELSVTPVKDANGVVTQFVGVQQDVTDRKRQEDELRVGRTRLQALFDHSNDGILLADDAGIYVDANPAACRMLGYPREELLGLGVADIFSASDRSWTESSWAEFLQIGTQRGECTLRRKDATLLRADYSGIARIQPGLHLAILRDISERHALQSQLLRQQRLESVGRLASGVAHDLNNILTPILMAPAMLRAHVQDAGARMLLETLESGARRGSAIVHQLLAFSRGEPGDKTRVNLQKVVRDSSVIIRETFPKNVILDLPAASGEFVVMGDGNQLQQVILNLALNAADAMHRGGRLVLSLDHIQIPPAEAARDPGTIAGHHVLLTVADHGTGIAPDVIDKIFDPFFTTKPFGQGSGLGLSVVLGIVRAHGGFIRVNSRVGVGTIMKIHLPVATDLPPPPLTPPSSSAPPTALPANTGRTVLVVDDESDVRDIIRITLTREGYRVMCAAGADAAFTQIQSCGGRVDLILTDLSMPGVSGVKFIEMLRSRRPDQPILVMTGNDSPLALVPSIRAAVCDVVPKPFTAETLALAVHKALPSP